MWMLFSEKQEEHNAVVYRLDSLLMQLHGAGKRRIALEIDGRTHTDRPFETSNSVSPWKKRQLQASRDAGKHDMLKEAGIPLIRLRVQHLSADLQTLTAALQHVDDNGGDVSKLVGAGLAV